MSNGTAILIAKNEDEGREILEKLALGRLCARSIEFFPYPYNFFFAFLRSFEVRKGVERDFKDMTVNEIIVKVCNNFFTW